MHYQLVYTDWLSAEETLDSIYERFNTNHQVDFTGHSLSISDGVVFNENGTVKVYIVDSISSFDDLDISIEEAEQQIISDEGLAKVERIPMDYELFQEKVETTEEALLVDVREGKTETISESRGTGRSKL